MTQQTQERRAHRRLEIRLPLQYHREGVGRCNVCRTTTLNVSTGGVYFETTADDIQPADTLAFELGIPEGDARFPMHGKIATTGKVVRTLRIDRPASHGEPAFIRYGVGAQFQQGFRLIF